MATNKKITDLTELSEVDLADDDMLAIVDVSAGTTNKVRKSTLASALSGVSSITAATPIAVDQSTGAVVVSTGTIPITLGGTGETDAPAALAALGGVSGPASATDNAVARFDATTGKLIQNSTVTISDAGAVTAASLNGILGSGTPAAATVTQLTSGGVIVSDTDSTDDLGTTGVRWANTWTDAINGVTSPTAQYTSAEETKLAGIETAADVTDATNVLAALVGQEAVATGFTGTLDGVLGGGSPAAASVTTLTTTGLLTGGTIVLAATDTDTSNTGSVTIDFATHQNFVLTLTGSVTLANPTTEAVGQAGVFVFIQDGTGSRTLSLGTDYETAAGAGIVLSTAAGAVDVVPYFVKASGSIQLGAPQLAFA